jgi:hypothetical protein
MRHESLKRHRVLQTPSICLKRRCQRLRGRRDTREISRTMKKRNKSVEIFDATAQAVLGISGQSAGK